MIFVFILGAIILAGILVYRLNRYYNFLALCRRIQATNGRPLEETVCTIPGKTIFGNNFDTFNIDMAAMFNYLRNNVSYSKGRNYVLNIISTPLFNVCTAEDAEQVLQCQSLLKKGIFYQIFVPLMGDGLLLSKDKKWFARRKMLTPAFHFSILQNFLTIFKEESEQMTKMISKHLQKPMVLEQFIPEFTLNNICDTAMGVKLSELPGNDKYRRDLKEFERASIVQFLWPIMCLFPWMFRLHRVYKTSMIHVREALNFSSKVIQKKREEYLRRDPNAEIQRIDEFGKKNRVAMLDTLLEAEKNGLIDHQGICDEVNTFMAEGFDTVSITLLFCILNLANRMDLQDKCYQEIRHIGNIDELTQFDFNQFQYLECFIKEVFRMYPPVPVVSRRCQKDTELCGLLLPAGAHVNVHIYDVMRDPRHFPNPSCFDPTRFLPENCANRHPFAFIPFSAGPRNCIGQRFAILETKVILTALLKNFVIWPITRLEDIILENSIVLRTQQDIKVRFERRV